MTSTHSQDSERGASRVSDATKRETVAQILRGDVSLADAARRHRVQSYQLHAWIGYVALKFPETVQEALERRFPRHRGTDGSGHKSDETARAKELAAEVITEVLTNLLARKQ